MALAAVATPGVTQLRSDDANAIANDLKICLRDTQGFRGGAQLANLQTTVDLPPSRRWMQAQVAPGVYRLTNPRDPLFIEIKLPDANGQGHCFALAPSMTAEKAAAAADRFVELGFADGLIPGPAGNGVFRRYVREGLPFQMELVAFEAQGFGAAVGLSFAGVTAESTEKRVLAAQPTQASAQNAAAFLPWALEVCIRNLGREPQLKSTLESAGFEAGLTGGGGSPSTTYFLPDNSISVRVNSYTCEIDTRQMAASTAAQSANATLSQRFPGQFQPSGNAYGACTGFFRSAGGPLAIYIGSLPQGMRRVCAADGTTRIQFEIPG